MKLVIICDREKYDIYEVAEDGGRTRITSFNSEQRAREYCEERQKARVIAEYELG